MMKKIKQENRRYKSLNKKTNSNVKIVKLNLNKIKQKESKTDNNNEYINNNIIVILRIRPETLFEKNFSNIKIINIENSISLKLISPIEYERFIEGTKYINNEKGLEVTKTEEYIYKFNHIFDYISQQNQVYEYTKAFLIKNIFDGFNSTIFTYGSIGSGKSYTMFGTNDKPGIIIRAINDILAIMKNEGLNNYYDLQISFFKIYNETVIDLINNENKNNQKEKELNKQFLKEISKKIINEPENIYQILFSNKKNKSSKAHYIVEINIINNEKNNFENNINKKFGKFIMIDLAGFEKVSKVKFNTDNYYINKSIFTLSACIDGLINHNKKYIPWRDSKLTMILRDYLLGNSKVVMIANISPSFSDIEGTLNTLNFSKKIKQVKINTNNKVETQIHIDKFETAITDLKEQISKVRKEINTNENKNKTIEDDKKIDGNEILKKYIEQIKTHFNQEIELNKQINDIEFNIIAINMENYFNKVNNDNINKENNKLNDYQLTINSLYEKRNQLIEKRRIIQTMITDQTKKNNHLGKYLMYVYKYYINLINQYHSKNRQNKLNNDKIRKDNQISNLSKQIKIRDELLKDMSEKIGKPENSFGVGKLVDLEEINFELSLNISKIKKEKDKNIFINDNALSSINKLSRNISMPILKVKSQRTKTIDKKRINVNNKIFPIIQIINDKIPKNDSSILKKRIPSGYIIMNRGKRTNFKNNYFNQYQKYYNLYHISNNYHVGDFKIGNINYNKNGNLTNLNTKERFFSYDFENEYKNKVKTILNKNYILRYNNSPYLLENQ